MSSIELTPIPPYDFSLALAYLRRSSSAVLERISDDGVYHRAVNLAGRDLLLTLHAVGSVDAPRLKLTVQGEQVSPALMDEAARLVRRIFALDDDPTKFYHIAETDPVFGAVAQRYYGLRPVMIIAPFEALIWAVIGQQINISFARKLKQRLVELAGQTLHIAGDTYPMMPTAAAIASLDPALLPANQFSRQKASYVIGLAQAVASGELDFAALPALPHEQAVASLTRWRGLGRWTAEYVLMRGLGTRDSIPAADMGLRAIFGRAYKLGRHASEDEVREIAAQWAGWRGWAAFYWWMALQMGVEV